MALRCLLLGVIFGVAACAETQDFSTDRAAPAADVAASAPGGDGNAVRSCDTRRDPDHCGVCGHRCLGGACLSGVCQPVELARESTPMALAVTGEEVTYLVADLTNGAPSAIRRVSARGGPARTIATMRGVTFGTMRLYDGSIYASYQRDDQRTSAIGRLAPGAAAFTDILVAPEQWGCGPRSFAVTPDGIAFDCDMPKRGVFACALGGCAGAVRALDSTFTDMHSRGGLVAVGTSLLASSDVTHDVRRIAVGEGPSCDLGIPDADAAASEIAFDGATAFVGRRGSLLRVEPTCGAVKSTVLVKSPRLEAPHLAVNGSDVLWGEQSLYDGSLWRCAKAGCAEPEMIATGQGFVSDVVATNDAVYWITAPRVAPAPVPGTVMKLALPPRPVPSPPLR